MKFTIQGPFKENVNNLMRSISYHFLGEEAGEMNYVHPIGINNYPRFHVYLKTEGDDLVFNLHLDQRKPVYEGAVAHSGEYDGALVEQEAERIKRFL